MVSLLQGSSREATSFVNIRVNCSVNGKPTKERKSMKGDQNAVATCIISSLKANLSGLYCVFHRFCPTVIC